MQNETNPPHDGSQGPNATAQKCIDVVNGLVEAGNPKSNLFAICIICDATGDTRIAVKAVETLTALDVARQTQHIIDQLWSHASAN